jgi:S-adenosylmethionine hydrolase
VYEITAAACMRREVSTTFHGRDIFAPAAGFLASGGAAADVGPAVAWTPPPPPVVAAGVARVIHVDHFGNLITDRAADALPAGAHLVIGDVVIRALSRAFGDVAPGELLAYIGSAGLVEVAVREGDAAARLGLGVGDVMAVHAAAGA